ncbi:MAG: hypothetical protein ABSF14_01585 [Terriglobia bacterium]
MRPIQPVRDYAEPQGAHGQVRSQEPPGQPPPFSWRRQMRERLRLPATVHHHGPCRVGQRRFCDLHVWSERKRLEKLDYLHGNPVNRGLVTPPDPWPWSSFRFHYLGDSSLLPINPLP